MTRNTHRTQHTGAAVLSVPARTAHSRCLKSLHPRHFGTDHPVILPIVRWVQGIAIHSTHRLLLSTASPNRSSYEPACALSFERNVKSVTADTDTIRPHCDLLTANPLEAVNRAIAATLDRLDCGGFVRFPCRKEETKA